MKERVKGVLITALGWAFLLLGFLGLFLPVLQGILFLLIGLYILSHRASWAKTLFDRIRRRYPGLSTKIHEAKEQAARWLKRGMAARTAPIYIKEEKKNMSDKPAKYTCQVCGYVYDPEKGDPDGGIQPGTPFKEIPDDWVCPICGVGKVQFEKEE